MDQPKKPRRKSKANKGSISPAKIRYEIIKEIKRAWSWYSQERKQALADATEWHPVTKYSKLSNPYQVKEKFIRCQICFFKFKEADVQVDHIDPVGRFPAWPPDPDSNDWNVYLSRQFCERKNLQALCKGCHAKKTEEDKEGMRDV